MNKLFIKYVKIKAMQEIQLCDVFTEHYLTTHFSSHDSQQLGTVLMLAEK
jgi:hypothetical protein